MEKSKTNPCNHILITGLLLFVIFGLLELRSCVNMVQDLKQNEVIKSDTVVEYITMPPVTVTHTTFVETEVQTPITIPATIDTQAVIKSYFSCRTFRDSIIDSNIYITHQFTICKNFPESATTTYTLLRPVKSITITNTILQQKPTKIKLLAGIHGGYSLPGQLEYGPVVMVMDKKGKTVGFAYDLVNKGVNVKFLFPLYQ